jgi:hypothetical protein
MHLDLRYPIGLLLTTFGVILVFEGAMFRETVLGLNVNLYWGALMIACGLGAIVLARRSKQGTSHTSQITSHKSQDKSQVANQNNVTQP